MPTADVRFFSALQDRMCLSTKPGGAART